MYFLKIVILWKKNDKKIINKKLNQKKCINWIKNS